MGQRKKKTDRATDPRFEYLERSKTNSSVTSSSGYLLKHTDGRIEAGLKHQDVDRRIRNKELSGMEWVAKGPGQPWVRLSEDTEFCELILHGLEKGGFQPSSPKQRHASRENSAARVDLVPEEGVFDKKSKMDETKSSQVKMPPKSRLEVMSSGRTSESPSQPQEKLTESAQEPHHSQAPSGIPRRFYVYGFVAVAFTVMALSAWWSQQKTPGLSGNQSRIAASWQPLRVDLLTPAPSEKNDEKLHRGLQEAKTFFYRDTSFYYRVALKEFYQLLKLEPHSAMLWSGIIESYLSLLPFAENKSSFFSALHELTEKALQMDPYSAHLKRAQARLYYEEGKLNVAREKIKQALTVDAKSPDALLLGAQIAWKGRQTDGAEKLFQQAVAAEKRLTEDGNPYFSRLHSEYAELLLELGKYEAALEQLRITLAMNPVHPTAYYQRAKVLFEQHKMNEAMEQVEQSTALSFFGNFESAARARFLKARIHEALGQRGVSQVEFQQAQLLDPENQTYENALKERHLHKLSAPREEIVRIFSDVSYFIKTGKKLLEKNRLTEALAQFEIARLMDPERAEVHFYIGTIVEKTGDFTRSEESIRAYQKAVELDPKMIEAHVRLGDIFRRYFLFEDAQRHLQLALEIHSGHPGANFYMGRYHEERANGVEAEVRKAIEYYDRARTAAPDNRDAVIRMCELAESLGIYLDAEAFYQRFLNFFPNDLEIQVRLQINRALQGRKATAVRGLKKLMETNPNPLVEGGLGLAYIASKDYQRGVQLLQSAIEKEPQNQWFRRRLAETYKFLGKVDQAVIQFKAISLVDPTNAFGFFQAGLLFYNENKLTMAEIEFKNAETVNYRYPLVHAYLADIYQKLNKPTEAAIALKKEIQKNPKLVKYRVQLAELLLKYNYLDEASEVLLEALKIEEKNLQLLYLMARVRREQGIRDVKNHLGDEKLRAALRFARLALDYYPDAGKVYLERGLIYRELGDIQQARENLMKYLEKEPLALDAQQVRDLYNSL